MKEKNNRGKFASKIGVILASAGSAVGLGNIWRFPTETGENGGAAFILLYIGCILLLGLPVMISEFLIGRRTHADASTAFELLAPKHKQWHWVGRLGVLSGIMIFSFYSVVAGWTVNYTVQAALKCIFCGFSVKVPEIAFFYTIFLYQIRYFFTLNILRHRRIMQK